MTAPGYLSRIVIDPNVMVGKPIIKGTRIPVDTILHLLANGLTFEEILEDYPHLTKEDILAAIDYSAEIVSGESIFPLLATKKHAAASH